MPVQGISKSFKDISATFSINPMNGDLIALKNANAIARSVRNLVLTKPGERPFNPALGSNVHNLLFEPVDRITAAAIKSESETIALVSHGTFLSQVTGYMLENCEHFIWEY